MRLHTLSDRYGIFVTACLAGGGFETPAPLLLGFGVSA